MLRLEEVTKVYRPGDPPALDGISLTVRPGEMVALLGPSGAGKSTLIRCVNGLVRSDSGRIYVGGQEVSGAVGPALKAVRQEVGLIFQEYHLIDRLTVLVNVLSGSFSRYPFWRNALGLWSETDRAEARRLLHRVGLGTLAAALARELSGGQRQRVAVARALMQKPRLLLGDEPVASLDPVAARSIMQLVAHLTAEQGLTTMLSLHDVALAREFCPRAVAISRGRLLYDGPMQGVHGEVLAQIYGQPGLRHI